MVNQVKDLDDHIDKAMKIVNDYMELLKRDGRPLTLDASAKEESDHIEG